RSRLRGRAGPHDMAEAAYGRLRRMDEFMSRVEPPAKHGAPGDQFGGAVVGHVTEIPLRLDNGVEIAAIGDIDLQGPEHRTFDLEPFGMEKGRHVGQPDLLDEPG